MTAPKKADHRAAWDGFGQAGWADLQPLGDEEPPPLLTHSTDPSSLALISPRGIFPAKDKQADSRFPCIHNDRATQP